MIVFRNPPTVAPPIGRYHHSVATPPNATLMLILVQVGVDSQRRVGRHLRRTMATSAAKCRVECRGWRDEPQGHREMHRASGRRYGPTRDEDRARITAISKDILAVRPGPPTCIPDLVRPCFHAGDRGRRCRSESDQQIHPRPSPAYRLPPRAPQYAVRNRCRVARGFGQVHEELVLPRWHEGMQRWPDHQS